MVDEIAILYRYARIPCPTHTEFIPHRREITLHSWHHHCLPCCSLILAISMMSRLGCWLCKASCRRDNNDDCGVNSGARVGTLLARCSCFFETLEARTVATECMVLGSAGFVLVLLVIAGVEDLDAENFLRFFLRAASAGPKPWANMWCVSWWCTWWAWEWWGCCTLCTSGPGVSREDLESDEPSDREPPSSDAGEYTESSDRDLPAKRRRERYLSFSLQNADCKIPINHIRECVLLYLPLYLYEINIVYFVAFTSSSKTL